MDIWKDIKGYEELYAVSNTGKIRSKEKWVINSTYHTQRLIKGRIMKPWLNKNGYYTIKLSKSSKRETIYIHQAVANLFISKVEYKPILNHKDGNKLNNHIDNLEWCTYSENLQHAYDTGLRK